MTPEAMATIYASAFPASRAWSAEEIAALIDGPGGFSVNVEDGFALGRVIVGEAELLTIAVAPASQGHGVGRRLLADFEGEARARGAESAFLEVADDNRPARALYLGAGWTETGRRKGYYARATGAVDALTMGKSLA